jgi:hypothetical protein
MTSLIQVSLPRIMTFLYFKLAFAGIFGGLLMLAAGLDLHWQGILAILTGLTALALGIRALGDRQNGSSRGDHGDDRYTPADFPLPDPMPGRSGDAEAKGRGNEAAPSTGEVAFAVVVPKGSASESRLKAIGQALQVWQSENGCVRRIVGLEQLLDGKFPETSRGYFCLPVMRGRWAVESVALVFVAPEANTRQTAKSPYRCLKRHAVEEIVSPEAYSAVRR